MKDTKRRGAIRENEILERHSKLEQFFQDDGTTVEQLTTAFDRLQDTIRASLDGTDREAFDAAIKEPRTRNVHNTEKRDECFKGEVSARNRYSHLCAFKNEGVIDNINIIRQQCAVVVGATGVGRIVAESLVRVGIGKLILVDEGDVEVESMGHMLHDPHYVGMHKLQVARLQLRKLNPDVQVETFSTLFNSEGERTQLETILKTSTVSSEIKSESTSRVDLVLCCVANVDARLFLNEKCLEHYIPFMSTLTTPCSSSVYYRFTLAGHTACLECIEDEHNQEKACIDAKLAALNPAVLPSCELIVAGLMSQSAMKFLFEFSDMVAFYHLDTLSFGMKSYMAKPNRNCESEMCQTRQREFSEEDNV